MQEQTDFNNGDFLYKKKHDADILLDNEPVNEPVNELVNELANEPVNDSDDDTYIDINDILKAELKKIYQIQVNNESLIIKHIGIGSNVPDMIIKENFGKNNNLSLYNCVYMESEIDFLQSEINNNKFLPIVKLVEKIESKNNIYSLSVKANDLFVFNESYTNFNLYLTYSLSDDYINHIELEKNINSLNIIEKMLESIVELGLHIL